MLHGSGCDKCTEPDCVRYKTLYSVVELTCLLAIRRIVSTEQ